MTGIVAFLAVGRDYHKAFANWIAHQDGFSADSSAASAVHTQLPTTARVKTSDAEKHPLIDREEKWI